MKKLIMLLSLIVIVSISGCANQTIPTVSAKGGIVITDFSFDQPTIYAGDTVGLNLEVQNVGGKPGTLTHVKIYGVNIGTGDYDWKEDSKPFDMSGLSDTLTEANPLEKIEGETRYFRWKPIAPKGIKATTKYNFGVRVEYEYTTDYVGVIRAVTDTYLETLPQKDREILLASGGVVSSSTSDGPLTISPESGRSFIVSGSSEARLIKFKITNVGGGYPYTTTGIYFIKMEPVEGTYISCPIGDIKLSKGEKAIFTCDFKPPSNIVNKIDIPFKIPFKYSYYVDGMTSITVEPSGVETTITTTTIPNCGEGTAYGGVCKADQTQCSNDCSPKTGSCIEGNCASPNTCCCLCTTSA